MHASLEESIQDGLGQVAIMHDITQCRQRFVGREQNGPATQIAFIDDSIEHVRRVGRMGEISKLVDDQDVRMEIGL